MGGSGSTPRGCARTRPGDTVPTKTRRLLAALAAGSLGGACLSCSGTPRPAHSLGTDLGTFSVQAEQLANSCGENVLGSSEHWAFDVDLAQADTELFWDGRIGGRVAASGEFEFAATVSVSVRPARGNDAGCNVVRDDAISGALVSDDAGSVTGFSGEMSFAFSAAEGATCTLDEQDTAGLPQLPCSLSYALDASRTRAPTP
jgi:hypothetical protein